MIAYEAIGPNANGDFIIAYPTPGAPHVMTAAGVCSGMRLAQAECARLNEAQVAHHRAAMLRHANMIVRDKEN